MKETGATQGREKIKREIMMEATKRQSVQNNRFIEELHLQKRNTHFYPHIIYDL